MNTLSKGDFGSRLNFTITSDGSPFDLSNTTSKTVIIDRPDGSNITGTLLLETDGLDGKAYYTIASGDLLFPGLYSLQCRITKTGQVLNTITSKFIVTDTL